MVNNNAKPSAPDYGIIHQAFNSIIRQWKRHKKAREEKTITRLIEKAEALRELTGFRYYVIRFKGKIRLIPKARVKEWLHKGVFKKGTSLATIEKSAIYITKLKPASNINHKAHSHVSVS